MISIKKELQRSGNIMFFNKGTSMLPLIRQGRDLMIIRARKDSDIRFRKLDVVLFERINEDLVLHRITDIKKDGYLILGDNCINKEFVPERAVIGKLVGVVRDGKRRVNVSDKRYIAYSRIWTALYPIRRWLLRIKNLIK